MKDRGLKVDHSTIGRWVLTYSPEIEKRTRRFLKPTNDSCQVDETYIKVRNAPPLANWILNPVRSAVNGKWKYLYRAVDSEGNTLDFMQACEKK